MVCQLDVRRTLQYQRNGEGNGILKYIKNKKTQDSFLIIGSGPSGLECARVLLKAGHKVTIAEAEKEAGGRIVKEASLQAWVNGLE